MKPIQFPWKRCTRYSAIAINGDWNVRNVKLNHHAKLIVERWLYNNKSPTAMYQYNVCIKAFLIATYPQTHLMLLCLFYRFSFLFSQFYWKHSLIPRELPVWVQSQQLHSSLKKNNKILVRMQFWDNGELKNVLHVDVWHLYLSHSGMIQVISRVTLLLSKVSKQEKTWFGKVGGGG